MSRGYSTPVLLCLCALAFILGRFVQQIPGLPEASRKVNTSEQSAQATAAMGSWQHQQGPQQRAAGCGDLWGGCSDALPTQHGGAGRACPGAAAPGGAASRAHPREAGRQL